MKADPLFLEGVGLDDYAEICEIAVLDAAGNVLMDTLVRPLNPIPPEVSAIHGITDRMVAGAPLFPEVLPELQGLLNGRTDSIRIYMSQFPSLCRNTLEIFRLWDITVG